MDKQIYKFRDGFFCIIYAACLAGCATVRDVQEIPQVKRTPPAEAVQVCPKLTPIKSAGFGDVVRKLDEVSTLYYQCSSKHGELVDWINRGDD